MQFNLVIAPLPFPSLSVVALDIETADWASRQTEWISLVQLAYRVGDEILVQVFDCTARGVPASLHPILTDPTIIKVCHNAAFDIRKLYQHWGVAAQNTYCTMSAARKAGHKKYSLKDLAASLLNIHLNKSFQNSDFGRRPLQPDQIKYAAEDAAATLQLFEYQQANRTTRRYYLNAPASLPFSDLTTALVKFIGLQPGTFSPERMIANCCSPRSGVLGYLLDQSIGDRIPDAKEVTDALQNCAQIELRDRRFYTKTDTQPSAVCW